MSLLKQLAGETAIYGVSSILSRLLHYVILTPYLTRVFLPAEYGIVSDLYAWIALLMVFFTYRMETAFFRFGNRTEDLERTFSTASLSLIVSTVLLATVFIGTAPSIAALLRYPEHPEYIVWFTLIIVLDTLAAIPFARLRLDNRPIRFAIIKTSGILVNIFFIFFFLDWAPALAEQSWDVFSFVLRAETRITYVFVANALASGAVLLLLSPLYLRLRWQFDTHLWRRMLRYAGPLIVVGVAGIINQLVGVPLLKELASDDLRYNQRLMGMYAAAAKLAVLMNLFTQAFNYAAEPFFFRNAHRQDKDQVYAQVGQAFALVGSLAFLGIMLYLDVVQYFLGEDFREGLGVVPFLLLAYLLLGLYYNFSIWYKLADRTAIGGYIATGGALITLSLNAALIPVVGYYGPAWAALACYAFMAVASYWTGQRYYPIAYPVGRMAGYVVSAVAVYGVAFALQLWLSWPLLPMLLLNTGLLAVWVGGVWRLGMGGLRGA